MMELPIPVAPQATPSTPSWIELTKRLGAEFAARGVKADESDRFVAENFAALKQHGFASAGIPLELGGGGASYPEMCHVLRELAHYCSSTALAFAMHTHQVMVMTWKWRHKKAPVDDMLKRIADQSLLLLSSGGSDWLQGSGTATRVEGGYLISARKVFSSGAPAGNLLITSAIYDDPDAGATVLHFAVPMTASGISIVPTWQAMGMRGTGSHDIVLSNVFVPDQAISLRREPGKWHPAFHIVVMVALPLIYSVYVGVAEAARDLTIQQVKKRSCDQQLCYKVGGLDNELTAAKLALQHMISTSISSQPGFDVTNQVLTGRNLVARAVLNVVDQAMDVAGGRSFYRSFGLEKLFRDAQGVRYHPLKEDAQRTLSGQLALDWNLDSL
ncbi:MAG: acyl-CoA dehydrogenase family protein [Leptolyngbyaceae cyanobacterium MO_188.B28]|nr:acyl-CoA dehydrogenase family protein [Leptolyngbyaceae cyanobacterium MO_188.B28]